MARPMAQRRADRRRKPEAEPVVVEHSEPVVAWLATVGAPQPRDLAPYRQALRHRSAVARTQCLSSNERLEFLGDSILGAAVTAYITERYGDSDEGFLTNLRSQMVRGSTLCALARRLEMGPLLQLSEEHEARGGRDDDNTLEDVFEAMVGAMFSDAGFERTRRWLVRVFERYVDLAAIIGAEFTPRDKLRRCLGKRGDALDIVHERIVDGYRATAMTPDCHILAIGEASTKKEAAAAACQAALRYLSVS